MHQTSDKLSLIIVSYNTKALTLECLKSLNAAQKDDSLEIIVVDNASTDESISAIKKAFPLVKIIQNNDNVGFAKANNQAAKVARGEYLLFLNSDTQVKETAHFKLLAATQSHNASVSSCQLLNPNGSIQPQGGALPSLTNLLAQMLFLDDLPFISRLFPSYQKRNTSFFQSDKRVGWVGGTALLVKSDFFKTLDGFDENIFMYAEDVDLCWRSHKQGRDVFYFSGPQITHHGQASGNSKKAIVGELKGLVYLFKKHQPTWKLPLLRTILKLGCALRIVIFGIILRDEFKKSSYQEAIKLV